MPINRNGRILGSTTEWAKHCGITFKSAHERIRKARIPKYKIIPDYPRGALDFAEADKLWLACTMAKAGDWNQQQIEERKLREQLRSVTGDKTLMKGRGGRTSKAVAEEQRKEAIRRLMVASASNANSGTARTARIGEIIAEELNNGTLNNAAPNNAPNLNAPDLDEFEAAPGSNAIKPEPEEIQDEQEWSPGDSTAYSDAGLPDRIAIDNIDKLDVDRYVLQLIASGMTPKNAADYATKILKMKIDHHAFMAEKKSLVPLQYVRDFESQILTDLRGNLLPIGGELRDDLAACSDPIRCQEMIDERITGALMMVAGFKTGTRPDSDTNGNADLQ